MPVMQDISGIMTLACPILTSSARGDHSKILIHILALKALSLMNRKSKLKLPAELKNLTGLLLPLKLFTLTKNLLSTLFLYSAQAYKNNPLSLGGFSLSLLLLLNLYIRLYLPRKSHSGIIHPVCTHLRYSEFPSRYCPHLETVRTLSVQTVKV